MKTGDKPNKPTGAWRVEIRKKRYPRITRDFRTKGQAQTWKTDTESKMDQGTYFNTHAADSTLFIHVTDQYLEKKAILNRGFGYELYLATGFKRRPFAKKFMSDITVGDIETYRDYLRIKRNVSPGTIKRMFTNLSAIFEYARTSMDMEHLRNPVRSVELEKVEDERDVIFVGDQEARYFRAAQFYGRGIFIDVARFAIETTMRKSEMIGLDAIAMVEGKQVKSRRHDGILWHMVHLDLKIIKLPASIAKTGKKRDVPLSPLAIELIRKQMPAKGRPSPKGKVFDISPDGVRNAHNRTIKAAGIVGFWFRDLRHVGATKWSKVLPMLQLMRVTGHKDPRMLARYYNQEATEVANMMAELDLKKKSS